MPTYIALLKFTDQGIRNVKGWPTQLEESIKALERAGGRHVGFWWTQGAYDAVAVSEWPDDESASAFSLSAAMRGATRIETMRAYNAEEMQRILQKLP